MEIGLRYLHVIPEDLIETNLQRGDTGAFAFALFHRGDNLLAVLAEVAKLVELPIIAASNHAGIGSESGRLVGDGAFKALAHVGQFIKLAVQLAEQRAATDRRRRQKILEHRKLAQRFAQRDEFARRCQAESDSAREPLKVLDAAQLFSNLSAKHGLLQEEGGGFETRFDGVAIDERSQNPRPQ